MADSVISWKKIYGQNRNFLEPIANRYFFCENPKKITIQGYKDGKMDIKRPLHVDHMDRGNRILLFDGEVYLAENDIKDGLNKPENKGKGIQELFDELTKDKEGIFASDNQLKDMEGMGDSEQDNNTKETPIIW